MLKDTLIFGSLAGIIGNILKEFLAWTFYFLGIIKYTFVHFCAGMVVYPTGYVNDPVSIVVGILIDFTVAASFSLAFYLVIKKTGTAYWVLKGLGFGMIVFLICYGMIRPTFSFKSESPPLAVLMYMITNWIYGITVSWFFRKFGRIK